MAEFYLVRSVNVLVVFLALIWSSADASTNASFGESHPHTRWVDQETGQYKIDAYVHRLIVTRRGQSTIAVDGCWRGRAFLRDCKTDYFGVEHEGIDGSLHGDKRFARYTFRRIRPDPD